MGTKAQKILRRMKKPTYYRLLTSGKLTVYLADIDNQAQDMFDTIVNQTKEIWGITEELKAEEPMDWIRWMNAIVNMAEEFALQALIYA